MKQVATGGRTGSRAAAASKSNKKKPAPRKKRRRTGRQTLNYLLLLIVAAVIMLVLSFTVLFRVGSVVTDGLTRYAPQALRDECGVKEGDNLLRISERDVRKRIKGKFPYIEDLTLGRQFPDVLVLEVTEAKVLGACETRDGYVVVGEKGRILETGLAELPAGERLIYGMYIAEPKVGHFLGKDFSEEQAEDAAKETQAFSTLSDLIDAIESTEFDNVTLIDLSDTLNTAIVYEDRVLIELGSVADLSYKLQFVSYVLANQLPEGFTGVVDASYCTTSKSVVTSVKDITLELETRRARILDMTEDDEDGEDDENDKNNENDKNDEKDKETSSKSSDSKNTSSKDSSSEDSSSKEDDLYALRDEESSSSSEASDTKKDDDKGEKSDESPEESSSSEQMIGPYSADELAVKPGSEQILPSSSEASSENESPNTSD